jgi:hypothetical protein
MIRTILTPNTKTVSFAIPDDYVGKEIEIIAFSKNEQWEANSKENEPKKIVSFKAIAVDTKKFKFNRDDANER